VQRDEAPRIEPSARFDEVLLRLYSLPAGQDLYVVGPDDRLLGVLSLDAIKGHIVDQRDLAVVIAADIMDTTLLPVRPDDNLRDVAARFGESWHDRLPVVEGDRLIGTVAAADVLRRGRF
jgi:CIC family chloride channel protein